MVTLTNLYSSATATCTNTAGGCATTSTSVGATSDFFTASNAPLSTWDFMDVWREVPGSFPVLR